MQRCRHLSRLLWAVEGPSRPGFSRHSTSTQNVPAGHHTSDLSSTACNISLNRRRDITLRQDIRVQYDGKTVALPELFKDRDSLVVGIPDLSDSQKSHVHGYVKDIAELRSAGFQHIFLSAVASSDDLAAFLNKVGAETADISALADDHGTFTRMLGLELDPAGEDNSRSQRYIGFVQDGILTRICVEKSPDRVEVTSSSKALEVIRSMLM
eukprot:jgi/Ulvmu1/3176/UM015_0217.1